MLRQTESIGARQRHFYNCYYAARLGAHSLECSFIDSDWPLGRPPEDCFKLNTGSQTLSAEHLTKRGEYFPMSSLILMYHRVTVAGGGVENVHCLSMQSFAAQVAHLSESKIPVLSWRELCSTGGADEQLHIGLTFDDGSNSDKQDS